MFSTPSSDTKTTHSEVYQSEEFMEIQVPKLKIYFLNIRIFLKETTPISNEEGQKLIDLQTVSPSTSQTQICIRVASPHMSTWGPRLTSALFHLCSLYWPRIPCAPPSLPLPVQSVRS